MRVIVIFYAKSFRLQAGTEAKRKTFSFSTQENVSKLSSRALQWHKIDRAIENDCLFSIIYIRRCGNGRRGGGKYTKILPRGIERAASFVSEQKMGKVYKLRQLCGQLRREMRL